MSRRWDEQICFHVCPCCGRDWFHYVKTIAPIDEWQQFCTDCVFGGKVDAVARVLAHDARHSSELASARLNDRVEDTTPNVPVSTEDEDEKDYQSVWESYAELTGVDQMAVTAMRRVEETL